MVKRLLLPVNSYNPVKLSAVISPKNLFVLPIILISIVIVVPSISKAVRLPADEFNPPIMLEIPSCSISRFKVVPLWSKYISLSAA